MSQENTVSQKVEQSGKTILDKWQSVNTVLLEVAKTVWLITLICIGVLGMFLGFAIAKGAIDGGIALL